MRAEMVLFHSRLLPSQLLQANKQRPSVEAIFSKTLIPSTKFPKCLLFPVSSPNKSCHSVQSICCTTSASGSVESTESSASSTSSIFIKGLPQSTTEGHLKKAFSQFGEVSQVKIITDNETKQSAGYGYVWFTSEEQAQLAVEEMNGKFFDGRFILVKIGKPGLSKNRRRPVPYQF